VIGSGTNRRDPRPIRKIQNKKIFQKFRSNLISVKEGFPDTAYLQLIKA